MMMVPDYHTRKYRIQRTRAGAKRAASKRINQTSSSPRRDTATHIWQMWKDRYVSIKLLTGNAPNRKDQGCCVRNPPVVSRITSPLCCYGFKSAKLIYIVLSCGCRNILLTFKSWPGFMLKRRICRIIWCSLRIGDYYFYPITRNGIGDDYFFPIGKPSGRFLFFTPKPTSRSAAKSLPSPPAWNWSESMTVQSNTTQYFPSEMHEQWSVSLLKSFHTRHFPHHWLMVVTKWSTSQN